MNNKFSIKKNRHDIKRGWNKFAGFYNQNFLPPSSPSKQNLIDYRKIIASFLKPDDNVLILGMTPPLRKLFQNHEGKVVVADFACQALKATTKFLPPDLVKKEKRICVDWFNLKKKIKQNSIDLVVGDLITRNVSPQVTGKLFGVLKNLLEPKGKLILRVNLYNPRWQKTTDQKIIDLTLKDKSINKEQIGAVLTFRLTDCFKNQGHLTAPKSVISSLSQAISRIHNSGYLFILRMAKKNRKTLNFWRTILPKKTFETEAKKIFRIKEVLIASDFPDAEFFPIYRLEKQ